VHAAQLNRLTAMHSRLFGSVSVLMLSACAALSPRGVPTDILQKRQVVEAFVKRHGFTCAGHPEDEPVMALRSFDEFISYEGVLRARKCDLKPSAYSFKREKDGGVTFVFAQDREPHLAHMAGITADDDVWVNESYCELREPGFVRLPPGKSPEGARER
jgi:hypothetical protein